MNGTSLPSGTLVLQIDTLVKLRKCTSRGRAISKFPLLKVDDVNCLKQRTVEKLGMSRVE